MATLPQLNLNFNKKIKLSNDGGNEYHSFQVNEAKMMLSLLAYNLINWLRTLCFPEQQKSMQIQTIRNRIIKVASRLVKSARSYYFKLSSSFVYQKFFWEVFRRIQHLKCE